MGTPTRDDVWFCIHLYEQRREPVLRAAREWMNNFTPKTFKEVDDVMWGRAGEDANRYWRQVTSYWEMISTLLLSGGVTQEGRELFVKTTREFFFHFAKIAPFLEQIRAATRPQAFQNTEALCKSLPDYEPMMEYFAKMNEKIRAGNKKKPRASGAKKRGRK